MLNQKRKLTFWMLVGLLVVAMSACTGPEPAIETEAEAERIAAQPVSPATSEATLEATTEPALAPAPPATDLPTEIIEPISPLSPVPTADGNLAATVAETMDAIPGSEEPLAAALEDLSQRTGLPLDQISLVSMEARDWSDASLGCPQEGFMYAQVITPGYLITLEADGTEYSYHTDQTTQVVLCEE